MRYCAGQNTSLKSAGRSRAPCSPAHGASTSWATLCLHYGRRHSSAFQHRSLRRAGEYQCASRICARNVGCKCGLRPNKGHLFVPKVQFFVQPGNFLYAARCTEDKGENWEAAVISRKYRAQRECGGPIEELCVSAAERHGGAGSCY